MSKYPGDITILLAEDDRTMRKIEIIALKKLGFEKIIEAANGKEAERTLQQNPDIDLVISDWNMPVMSGLELLKWVRSSHSNPELPFVMATGQADKAHTQQAIKHKVTAFIVKPFGYEELKQTLDQAMSDETETADQKSYGTDNSNSNSNSKKLPRKNSSGKVILRISHIQITDHLVLGVLKYLIETGEVAPKHFELELHCMNGWNPVANSLEKHQVDAACILAPLAMDLYNFGVKIKIVLLSHRNGSSFVRTTKNDFSEPFESFYQKSSFLIPHKMSVQHMLSHMFLSNIGLSPSMEKGDDFDVAFEVVPPVLMPEFLESNSSNSGFMVAEPIGSQAVATGIANLQFQSSELWENHPCCVVSFQESFITDYPEVMHEFTAMVVKAGEYISRNPENAAVVACSFLDPAGELGLTVETLKSVLTEPGGITTDDLYPAIEDLDEMQRYMSAKMGINTIIDLNKLVDSSFADKACGKQRRDKRSAQLKNSREIAIALLGPNKNSNQKLSATQPVSKETDQISEKKYQLPEVDFEAVEEKFQDVEEKIKTPEEKKQTPEDKKQTPEDKKQAAEDKKQTAEDKKQATEENVQSVAGKYLTFLLNSQEYGISIMNIREIIGMIPITHVPRTPSYIKGVINLRGKVIPVMDLRLKFNMPPIEYTERTCIVIVDFKDKNSNVLQMGVVVDMVSEVLTIKEEEIDTKTLDRSGMDNNSILGMAKTGENVKILLEISTILSE
ncbi:Response regulator receiver modulated CheW protein [Desulfamplus magnetovallimortis]|uniref:Response regulator receiver modulated CheW protein n=1 Tax=Desulfamplus magnetovallimortis TaxID=1246637 RepID=A0A1W1HHV1_9BACT|nr:Response regulator receiver modulated CheW protein [Desulfamplus magnetovallimortis]